MKTLRRVTVFALCVSVAGCGILESGKPARQVYLLQTPSPVGQSNPAASPPALIISVKAVPGLDTDRILVLGPDARLVPVANAHWPDHMPEVFTSITRRYLSNTEQYHAVREGSIARPDEWLLELELQAFYGIQGSADVASSVVLQMEGALRCGNLQQVLRVEQQALVRGDNLSILVAAHQQVIDAGMQELSAKLSEACKHSAMD